MTKADPIVDLFIKRKKEEEKNTSAFSVQSL